MSTAGQEQRGRQQDDAATDRNARLLRIQAVRLGLRSALGRNDRLGRILVAMHDVPELVDIDSTVRAWDTQLLFGER